MTTAAESTPVSVEQQALLEEEMSRLVQEQVRVLLLDRQNRVVDERTIYQGNAYCALARPAEVFRPAVVEAVPQIVVVHNHPSGAPNRAATTSSSPRTWSRPAGCWASNCSTTS